MKKINYIILLMLTIVVASCEPTYKKEYSWAYPVAGDWTLNTYAKDKAGKDSLTSTSPFEFKTYNSSFGKDSIWMDDYGTGVANSSQYGNFWTMKYKVKVDVASRTFANADSVLNKIPGYPIYIKVKNGKVIGNDSIRFEVQFEDDATPYGSTYILAGHRTTSYEEYMQQ